MNLIGFSLTEPGAGKCKCECGRWLLAKSLESLRWKERLLSAPATIFVLRQVGAKLSGNWHFSIITLTGRLSRYLLTC